MPISGNRNEHRRKLIVFLSILLITGFVITSIVYYFSARATLNEEILNNDLPLTSDCIKSSLNTCRTIPLFVTSEMADSSQVRNFLLNDKVNVNTIIRYLDLIRMKHKLLSCSLSSAQSSQRYCSGGSAGKVYGNIEESLCMKLKALAGTSMSMLKVENSGRRISTMVSCRKIFDSAGNLIGIAEAEFSLDDIIKRLEEYRNKYNRDIYLVNTDGVVVLHNCPHYNCNMKNLQQIAGLSGLTTKIFKAQKIPLTITRRSKNFFFYSRFIPELNCFILIRQSSKQASDKIMHALWVNILVCIVITVIAIITTNITLNIYQARMERISIIDHELKNINQSQQEEIRKQHKLMLENNRSLKKALADVKQLSGLLPICANCKKVRDSKGYWEQLESYISSHSSAEFSHGLCPECAQKLYPNVFKQDSDYDIPWTPSSEDQKKTQVDRGYSGFDSSEETKID